MKTPVIEGLVVLPTQRSVADVLARIHTFAEARGITVFATIDFSDIRNCLPLKLLAFDK